MKDKNKLLPCPLCKGNAVRESDWIECEQCGLRLDEYEDFETVWNTRAESEVSKYKNALEVARAEYLAIIDSEFDNGNGEQIKAFMEKYDKLIQDTIKASQ
jgi:hypothetical protein